MKDAGSRPRRRYLAVWFPFLSADRLRRHDLSHARDDAPVCFIEKQNSALRVATVNQAAAGLGLHDGLTLADARARVPDLLAIDMDRDADMAWLERIADFCGRYTPMLALDSDDGITLDITGCAHLFGGESALRDNLLSRLAGTAPDMRAAIAGTPQAAQALARFGKETVLVPPGHEAGAVAPLPVAALAPGKETVVALTRAGLKTIGDLAARPRTPLAARFGAGLTTRLARCLGEENAGITPRRALPPCSAERRFAEPIARVEDALGMLERLAGQIETHLEARGEGGRRFEALFFRTDNAVRYVEVETAQPVRAPETLVRLFRERIDTLNDPLDPGFGYDLIRLSVTACAPFHAVQHSLDGRDNEDQDVSDLIDRLSTRFGRDAVLQFSSVGTHIPEKAVKTVPAAQTAPPDDTDWRAWPDDRPRRPVHLFTRPEPIEAVAEIPDGPPLRFRWRRVLHEIARAEGPERIAPEWWRSDDQSPTRDYYCVEDASGRRFWVFREGLYGRETGRPRWFLHGLFA